MNNIFNSVDETDHLRYSVFLAIVRFVTKRGRVSVLVPQLPQLAVWASSWNLTPAERSGLFKLLKDEFNKQNLQCVLPLR